MPEQVTDGFPTYSLSESDNGIASFDLKYPIDFEALEAAIVPSQTFFRCQCVKCDCWDSPMTVAIRGMREDESSYYDVYNHNQCLPCLRDHSGRY